MGTADVRLQEGTAAGLGRILSKDIFLCFLDREVKRALRYQNFICILLMELKPCAQENDGKCPESCQETLASVLTEEMRETDIIGSLDENKFATLLPYAGEDEGNLAKARLESQLKYYDFRSRGYEVKVQLFCFPRDGTTITDLIGKRNS